MAELRGSSAGVRGGTHAVERAGGAGAMPGAARHRARSWRQGLAPLPVSGRKFFLKHKQRRRLAWALRDSCTERDSTRARSVSV